MGRRIRRASEGKARQGGRRDRRSRFPEMRWVERETKTKDSRGCDSSFPPQTAKAPLAAFHGVPLPRPLSSNSHPVFAGIPDRDGCVMAASLAYATVLINRYGDQPFLNPPPTD